MRKDTRKLSPLLTSPNDSCDNIVMYSESQSLFYSWAKHTSLVGFNIKDILFWHIPEEQG